MKRAKKQSSNYDFDIISKKNQYDKKIYALYIYKFCMLCVH